MRSASVRVDDDGRAVNFVHESMASALSFLDGEKMQLAREFVLGSEPELDLRCLADPNSTANAGLLEGDLSYEHNGAHIQAHFLQVPLCSYMTGPGKSHCIGLSVVRLLEPRGHEICRPKVVYAFGRFVRCDNSGELLYIVRGTYSGRDSLLLFWRSAPHACDSRRRIVLNVACDPVLFQSGSLLESVLLLTRQDGTLGSCITMPRAAANCLDFAMNMHNMGTYTGTFVGKEFTFVSKDMSPLGSHFAEERMYRCRNSLFKSDNCNVAILLESVVQTKLEGAGIFKKRLSGTVSGFVCDTVARESGIACAAAKESSQVADVEDHLNANPSCPLCGASAIGRDTSESRSLRAPRSLGEAEPCKPNSSAVERNGLLTEKEKQEKRRISNIESAKRSKARQKNLEESLSRQLEEARENIDKLRNLVKVKMEERDRLWSLVHARFGQRKCHFDIRN